MATTFPKTSETRAKTDAELPRCSLEPLDDRVAVLLDKANDRHGAILLPGSAQEVPRTGTVVAVGPGRRPYGMIERAPVALRIGDRVAMNKHAGTDVCDKSGTEFRVVREDDIHCRI